MERNGGDQMRKEQWKSRIWRSAAFAAPIVVYVVMAAAAHLYPFGSVSNLLEDLDIQYIDYFAWLQKVLQGDASLFYSFSKSLGGPTVALFGYYLMNPLNLLCVFFSQEKLPLFIFMLTALKLGLCGITANLFFRKRFAGLKEVWVFLLGFAYALMQYNMTQVFNIMWLDGVIMLPLVMLGVYRCVEKKKYGLFYASTGINIILNWYTGYMVCLFSVCWFLFEWVLKEKQGRRAGFRLCGDFVKFCVAEALGVMLSACVFYPVMIGLSGGKKVFDSSIFTIYTHDPLVKILRGFVPGTVGNKESLSIYCGIFMLILVIFFFLCKRIPLKEKIASGVFLGFMLVSCWLMPLECIWNGLRYAWSYYCRFSFLVIFLFLFIAASALERVDFEKDKQMLIGCAGGFAAVLLCLDYTEQFNPRYLVAAFLILGAYILIFAVPVLKRWRTVLIGVLLAVEIACNGCLDFRQMFYIEGDRYENYVPGALRQSEDIREYNGGGFYRIEQTSARDDNITKCTPYFNESLAYGYSGISHYSSAYEMSTAEFISSLGYSDAVDFTIYDEAILPSDSLLGIKYAASKNAVEVSGYEAVSGLSDYNGKIIYENPYALSLGFGVSENAMEPIENGNPFEYQNLLFSSLLGREIRIFEPVDYAAEKEGEYLQIRTAQADQEGLLYGYMRGNAENLKLYVDGEYRCDYQCWLSYLVFNLGDSGLAHEAVFEGFWDAPENAEIQFYRLDMELFQSAVEELRNRQMDVSVFEDGYVSGSYHSQGEGWMLVTVPYDTGWTVTVNGLEVQTEQGAGVLTMIPVTDGDNQIEMVYHAHGTGTGILISLVSLGVWTACCILRKRTGRDIL